MNDIKYYEDRLNKSMEQKEKLINTLNKYLSQEIKLQKSIKDLGFDINKDNYKEIKEKALIQYTEYKLNYDLIKLIDKYIDNLDLQKDKLKAIEDQNKLIDKYKLYVDKLNNYQNIIDNNIPQIFKDFLNKWKDKVYDYYINGIDNYIKELKRLKSEKPEYVSYYKDKEKYFQYKNWEEKYEELQDPIFNELINTKNKEEYLNNLLEKEKQNKLIDLNNRVTKVVGNITDASNLKIGIDGNINGIIIGDKNKAKVTTIGAGGYNIQVYHFRVLVKEVK